MAELNNDPTQAENLPTEVKPSVSNLLSRSFSVFDSGVVPCFFEPAHRHASDLLLGQAVTVRLRGLTAPARCDGVGRVLLDGEDVGEELLQAGLTWYCERSALPNSALPEVEAEARASERGLWSDPEPVAPTGQRRTPQRARSEMPLTSFHG